ncbi:TIGR01210 family protein [Archaeoglobus sulfaticallidus PM70-1]|uniref:TIGR01210 family protein n=1 Tax=Archaeoglobus sulfaticallidus PM70-1 TaxID=387631 RepID=N0BK83_9EURY|nr:archaeosine biosynthesis radical SAM protein RaSEA [Archaeoglobus sulfaticallidus]AGK60911.1 TIGR01210 family protein [Archaeoglobus sulfaticallidus PM70-1]
MALVMLNKPVALWTDKELFWERNRVVDCITVILRTRGCYRAQRDPCRMCGYSIDSDANVTDKNLEKQLEFVEEEIKKRNPKILKIFTSGSFFDPRETSQKIRKKIYGMVKEYSIEKLIVESRPEFIRSADPEVYMEVGIGLESVNDFVRNELINKGFSFEEYTEAHDFLKSIGVSVKAYLLLKPPFLSEKEAIDDVLNSINLLDREKLADIISINPTNIQKGTYVERLWYKGYFRPPWLWSAVDVLKNSGDTPVICDPVAGGKARGPHNCYKCDGEVVKAIKNFSLTQNRDVLNLYCDCIEEWKDYMLIERIARLPLQL